MKLKWLAVLGRHFYHEQRKLTNNWPKVWDLMTEVNKPEQDYENLPELTAEEIDSYIEESDPELLKTLKNISQDKSLTIEQIVIDDLQQALQLETEIWANSRGLKRIIFRIFPPAPRWNLRFKFLKFRFSAWLQGQLIRLKNFLYFLATQGRRQAIQFLLRQKDELVSHSSKAIQAFKKMSWESRIVLLSGVGLFFAALIVSIIALTQKNVFPQEQPLFVMNLADYANSAYGYDPMKDVEPYIDNARAIQNLILIQKIVVNIKASQNSGPRPMLAAEFFVEGMSAEVVVEIKDREVAIRDLMQRTLEQMPYDLLDTADGKREMLSVLQKEISRVLTTGRVKNVRLKTIILKP